MKNVLLLTIFLFTTTIYAQESDYKHWNYGLSQTSEGAARLIADDVNLRSEPSTKSDVIALLSIGTSLEIKAVESKTLTIKGYKQPWVKVRISESGHKKEGTTGYIWGGLLADEVVEAADGVEIMYAVSSVEEKNWGAVPTLQARACRNGKELSKVEFEAVGSINTGNYPELMGNKGLDNLKNILKIGFSEDMCGGAFGDVYLFWDGKKLHHAKTLHEGFDAPMFATEEFIFPEDEGGKKGYILFKEEAGEDEGGEADKVHYEYQRTTKYLWTGSKLAKK